MVEGVAVSDELVAKGSSSIIWHWFGSSRGQFTPILTTATAAYDQPAVFSLPPRQQTKIVNKTILNTHTVLKDYVKM